MAAYDQPITKFGHFLLFYKNSQAWASILSENAGSVHQQTPILTRSNPLGNFLFNKLKLKINGLQYESIDNIETALTSKLNSVEEEVFWNGFTVRYTRSRHCIQWEGGYVEA